MDVHVHEHGLHQVVGIPHPPAYHLERVTFTLPHASTENEQ
jgi:hypothetical protein